MASTKSYDWLKVIEPELVKLQDVSTIGGPDVFSWSGLSDILAKRLQIPGLSISSSAVSWLSEKELSSHLGKQPWRLNFSLSGLPGRVCWNISERDLSIVMAALLTKATTPFEYSDKDFHEAFLHLLGAIVSDSLHQQGLEGDYAVNLVDSTDFPKGSGLSVDLDINILGTAITSRLLASEDLIEGWKEHFAASGIQARATSAAAQNFEVTVHFEAGKVTLPSAELNTLRLGDFLVLDSCTILPGEEKGRVVMTIRGVPVFRGMIKQNKVKVLEYPQYHEVDTHMDHDESIDFDDETEHDEEAEESVEDKSTGAPATTERAKNIPVTVNIEVGRINMKLEKLMQLQPGQLLELDVNPENGVDLVVNGHCIGRGELLKLGEALGVRILELS